MDATTPKVRPGSLIPRILKSRNALITVAASVLLVLGALAGLLSAGDPRNVGATTAPELILKYDSEEKAVIGMASDDNPPITVTIEVIGGNDETDTDDSTVGTENAFDFDVSRYDGDSFLVTATDAFGNTTQKVVTRNRCEQ